jgi:hypothetical protein
MNRYHVRVQMDEGKPPLWARRTSHGLICWQLAPSEPMPRPAAVDLARAAQQMLNRDHYLEVAE